MIDEDQHKTPQRPPLTIILIVHMLQKTQSCHKSHI